MGLLEFARGPALWFSLAVLLAGSLWRIAAIWRLGALPDLSEPSEHRGRAMPLRILPRKEMRAAGRVSVVNAYLYHLGLAVIVFGYPPHVAFVERLAGIAWPALPAPVTYVAAGITFVSLFLALLERATDPVRRLLSGFDDYFSWCIVFLPLATGMIALEHSRPLPIAAHLLSVELLLAWLPFGKLGHAFLVFFSRGATGAALARKGAAI